MAWWPVWLLLVSTAIPAAWGYLDPPIRKAEFSGVVTHIQRMSGRSMPSGSSLSKIWVKVEDGAVVGFDVDPARYRVGQGVQVIQYQRELTHWVSWKLARGNGREHHKNSR